MCLQDDGELSVRAFLDYMHVRNYPDASGNSLETPFLLLSNLDLEHFGKTLAEQTRKLKRLFDRDEVEEVRLPDIC